MGKNTLSIRIMQILLAIFFSRNLVQITTAAVYETEFDQNVTSSFPPIYVTSSFPPMKNFADMPSPALTKNHTLSPGHKERNEQVKFDSTRKENSALQKENVFLKMTARKSEQSELLQKEKYQALELSMQKQREESEKNQQECSETKAQQNTIIQILEKKFSTLAWITFFLSIILFLFIIYIKSRVNIDTTDGTDHSETFSDTEHTVSDDILKVNTDESSELVTQEEKICFYSMGSDTYEKMIKQHFRSTSNNQHPTRLSSMHHESRKYFSRNNSSTSNNTSCKLEQSLSASNSWLTPDL